MVDVGHSKDNEDEKAEPTGLEDAGDATKPEPKPGSEPEPEADAEPEAKKGKKKPRSFWVELPILIGVALVLTILIQTFLARVFLIPSESMEHTLHGCAGCYGDRVLVDKLTYVFHDPRPGDVVVFQRPDTWNQSEFRASRSENTVVRWFQDIGAMFGLASPNEDDVVKRVIATGGQTVECCDEQGRVQVDGRSLDEPYVFWDGAPNGNQQFPEFQVPDGMLWVLGDNRNNSCDSRCQGGGGLAGAVPVDNVIGKARFIVLPPGRWQGVGDHNPQFAAALGVAVPTGLGVAAAFPTLWVGRRLIRTVRRRR